MAKDNDKGVLSSLKSLLTPGESDPESATAMLRADHRKVDQLFRELESADKRRKTSIASQVVRELRAHTRIEEEIFYPAVAGEMEDDQPVECAFEEHGLAKKLVEDLAGMGPGDEHFDAKVKVLGEVVRHHVREEESEVLPAAESSELDLDALGERMALRKKQLLAEGGTARRKSAGSRATAGAARASRALAHAGRPSGRGKAATKKAARSIR